MKLVKIMTMGALTMLIISGCSSKPEPVAPTQNAGVDNIKDHPKKEGIQDKTTLETSTGTDKQVHGVDYSQYYTDQDKISVIVSGKQIVWKNKDVIFTAKLIKATGEEAAEASEVIDSMNIKSKYGEHAIKLNPRPLRINSLSLSQNNQMALDVSDHEGSRLILMNLSNGAQTIANLFKTNDDGASSEKIDAYNWSPDGKKIAFGIGDLGSSYVAVYDTEHKSYTQLSDKNFTLISSIVWHKDGKNFDFVSKNDLPQATLYSYLESKNSIISKGFISEKDEQKLSQLVPKF